MKELLESGVHFGHQTRRWNPRMKPYIFTERGGIYIIDLQKTIRLIDDAFDFVKSLAADGKKVLFVGTKKQCQDNIAEEATRSGMPFVSHRWLGGLLTNFNTINQRIKRMHDLRRLREEGQLDLLPTREQMNLLAELRKLETNLGGVADMDRLPAAVFVIDPRREAIVIKEARKLHIPIVGLVDTNCNPDEVDFVIPGNDDAIRSCGLIIRAIADGILEGRQLLSEKEMRVAAAAAEAAKVEAAKAEAAAAAAAKEQAAKDAAAPAAKAEAKPSGGKPSGGKPAPGKPAGAKPAGGKPAGKPKPSGARKPAETARKAPAAKPAAKPKPKPEAAKPEAAAMAEPPAAATEPKPEAEKPAAKETDKETKSE
jgi:small subunit ribosomal protein S2